MQKFIEKAEGVFGSKQRMLASVGIVAALIIGVIIHAVGGGSGSGYTGGAKPKKAEEIVNGHLAWADRQSNADRAVQPIRELFVEARLGSRKFAQEALGLKSKWRILTDFLTDGQDHKAFLEEQFATHVFAPDALEKVVQIAVAGHIRKLDDVDNELLVRLQTDLESVPNLELSAGIDRTTIQMSLDAAVRQAINAVQAELLPGAGLELVSYVAGEVLTSATFSLGASTGILSAGAASGVVSVGVGLLVGIVVDAVVGWVYDAMYDPVGQLTTKINQTLDELEQQILSPGA